MIEILSICRFFGYTIHTMDSRRKMRFVRCLLKLDLRDLDNGRTANLTMLLQKGRSLRRNTHAESRGQERPAFLGLLSCPLRRAVRSGFGDSPPYFGLLRSVFVRSGCEKSLALPYLPRLFVSMCERHLRPPHSERIRSYRANASCPSLPGLDARSPTIFAKGRPKDNENERLPSPTAPIRRGRCLCGWKSRLKKIFLSPD